MAAAGRVSAVLSHLQLAAHPASAASTAPLVSITSRDGGVAIITVNNPPVNSLHPSVQSGLDSCYRECCEQAASASASGSGSGGLRGVVITGAGSTFMAGADIAHLAKQQKSRAKPQDIAAWISVRPQAGRLPRRFLSAPLSAQRLCPLPLLCLCSVSQAGDAIFNNLESGALPTVAAVNGDALGGGCELALACNARVCSDSAAFGLPELSLGIIPGLGGTQRLPRVIGLEAAVALTLTGKKLKAKEALAAGLVDAVVKRAELLDAARRLVLSIADGKRQREKALYRSDRIGQYDEGRGVLEMQRSAALKKNRQLPQPFAYLDAVEAGLRDGAEAGLRVEAARFSQLVGQPVSRALIHFFFASRATSRVAGLPSQPSGPDIKTVAVIGGGTMGAGICIAFLSAGYSVILKEISAAALEAGVGRIVEQTARVIKSRKMPLAALEVSMRRLNAQTSFDGFQAVDLVIEAALEDVRLKQELFAQLEQAVGPHCLLASNTSTIDLQLVGAQTRAQSRLVGLHFFSPAHVMPLLEIVRTTQAAPEAVARCLQLSKRIGKTPVVVANVVGFGANRGFFPYGQAGGLLIDCGLSPYRIDAALEAFGMPMGVFKMTDLSGLDIAVHVSRTIAAAYGDRVYLSSAVSRLQAAGRLGQKSGQGFYRYVKGKPQQDAAAISGALQQARKDAGGLPDLSSPSAVSDAEIVELVLFPVVNEFLRLVSEAVVGSHGDVDVLSVMGYGFPAWRGGVLFWAEDGVDGGFQRVRQQLAAFSARLGRDNPQARAFFQPCSRLEQLADSQQAEQRTGGSGSK